MVFTAGYARYRYSQFFGISAKDSNTGLFTAALMMANLFEKQLEQRYIKELKGSA